MDNGCVCAVRCTLRCMAMCHFHSQDQYVRPKYPNWRASKRVVQAHFSNFMFHERQEEKRWREKERAENKLSEWQFLPHDAICQCHSKLIRIYYHLLQCRCYFSASSPPRRFACMHLDSLFIPLFAFAKNLHSQYLYAASINSNSNLFSVDSLILVIAQYAPMTNTTRWHGKWVHAQCTITYERRGEYAKCSRKGDLVCCLILVFVTIRSFTPHLDRVAEQKWRKNVFAVPDHQLMIVNARNGRRTHQNPRPLQINHFPPTDRQVDERKSLFYAEFGREKFIISMTRCIANRTMSLDAETTMKLTNDLS